MPVRTNPLFIIIHSPALQYLESFLLDPEPTTAPASLWQASRPSLTEVSAKADGLKGLGSEPKMQGLGFRVWGLGLGASGLGLTGFQCRLGLPIAEFTGLTPGSE